jgi:hypothetical protein
MWKILEIYADGEKITSVKYFCSISDQENTVETEGYWFLPNGEVTTPFSEVTEEMVAKWVEDSTTVDGVNIIKSRLEEQLQSMKNKPVVAPWLPQTFTPQI